MHGQINGTFPKVFLWSHGDQHLLLNRSNPNHVNEIISKLEEWRDL